MWREVKTMNKEIITRPLKHVPTTDIIDELKCRDGISFMHVPVTKRVDIELWNNRTGEIEDLNVTRGPISMLTVKKWE